MSTPGNQNAAKDDPRETWLQVRCLKTEKGAWIKHANREAQKKRQHDERGVLSGWVRDTLNQAAGHPPPPANEPPAK